MSIISVGRRCGGALAFMALLVSGGALAQPAGDPATALAPPPFADTPAAAADLAGVMGVYPLDRIALADRDRDFDPFTAFGDILGPAFNAEELPVTTGVLAWANSFALRPALTWKGVYPRLRPFVVYPDVARCPGYSRLAPDDSYPSAHAAIGYAWAIVLASLVPEQSDAILARGLDYGFSRVVCGFHWPSDVEAGQAIGADAGQRLLGDPSFQQRLAGAREELLPFRAHDAAGLPRPEGPP